MSKQEKKLENYLAKYQPVRPGTEVDRAVLAAAREAASAGPWRRRITYRRLAVIAAAVVLVFILVVAVWPSAPTAIVEKQDATGTGTATGTGFILPQKTAATSAGVAERPERPGPETPRPPAPEPVDPLKALAWEINGPATPIEGNAGMITAVEPVTLTGPCGSTLKLEPESVIVLPKKGVSNADARRVTLIAGKLNASITKSEDLPFVVATTAADIVVKGTEFSATLQKGEGEMKGKTILTVMLFAGAIALVNPYGTLDMLPGDKAWAADDKAPARVEEPVEEENLTPEERAAKVEKDTKAAAESVNKFALGLYAKLKNEKKGNMFFSPTSISTALAMTYAGAKGKTAAEMRKTLCFNLSDKNLHPAFGNLEVILSTKRKGHEVNIANALWGQEDYKFLKSFTSLLNKNYGAGMRTVNFKGATEQARKTINSWVARKTNRKIKDLIKPGVLNELTRLVLTNAIYFKGTWKYEFKKKDTKTEDFNVTNSKRVDVKMMHIKRSDWKYMKGDEFAALELPYQGEEVSMVIFLPDEVDGLPGFEKKLSKENISIWLSKMGKEKIDDLAVPRFKMTLDYLLGNVLQKMGMKRAFNERLADFFGMSTEKPGLYIGGVVHKAFVDVNEKGTEAAAATAVVMLEPNDGSSVRRSNFRADHPFVFMIRHNKTGAILFMGRVINPSEK